VVNVGSRQGNRERGENVFNAAGADEARSVLSQILTDEVLRERLKQSPSPYGNGEAAERIIKTLLNTPHDNRLLNKGLNAK